jgi:hypothetical protein
MARSWRLLRHCDGSTFNELMVAMNILAVAVLGYSLSSIGMIRQQTVSDNSTIAIHLAQDKMEELQSLGVLPEVDLCPSGGDRRISAKSGEEGIFDRCWTISQSPLDGRLKQIDVSVSWRDHREHQMTLSTLIFTGDR